MKNVGLKIRTKVTEDDLKGFSLTESMKNSNVVMGRTRKEILLKQNAFSFE